MQHAWSAAASIEQIDNAVVAARVASLDFVFRYMNVAFPSHPMWRILQSA